MTTGTRYTSDLVSRATILAALVSSFLQGGDKPTLMALAVAFGVEGEFLEKAERLKGHRLING